MRHPRVEQWEERLDALLRQVDHALEAEFGNLHPPHPARPTRNATANPQQDGLFRVTATFTPGFGSRHGRGYIVRIDTVTLDQVCPNNQETVRQRAVKLICAGLAKTFPDRCLKVTRDGPVIKIIGNLSLETAPA